MGKKKLHLVFAIVAIGCGVFEQHFEVSLLPEREVIHPGEALEITAIVKDPPEGVGLTFYWSSSDSTISGGGTRVTWRVPDAVGIYRVSVLVRTSEGVEVRAELVINVVAAPKNLPPQVVGFSVSLKEMHPGDTVDFAVTARDPEGQTLRYIWKATGGEIIGGGVSIVWIAPRIPGPEPKFFVIEVIVLDPAGASAGASGEVKVVPSGDP